MDGDTGLEVISLATGVLNDISGLRQLGCCPVSTRLGRQQRPADPAWQPGVGARKRVIRVRAKHSIVTSPTLHDCGACH